MLEELAYILIVGVIAAAYLPAKIADLIGFGGHIIVSTLIGSVVGIVMLFIDITLGVPALIVAAVLSLVASIVLDKLW